MLAAKSLGFINGEYAFINIDLYAQLHHKNRLLRPWLNTKLINESIIQTAISAYDALLTVTLKFDSQVEKYNEFKKKMKKYEKDETQVQCLIIGFAIKIFNFIFRLTFSLHHFTMQCMYT